jgi:predicted nucleotide-binding protein
MSETGAPTAFVGSSSEGLEFARAIRRRLEGTAVLTMWNEDFFKTGSTFIETLVNAVSQFDFAILLLTPDDLVSSRNHTNLGPRDNVIFELGLFMGRLGRERTFAVYQKNAKTRIPTDLSGVVLAGYDWPRPDKNHGQAVGPASDLIREQICRLGPSPERSKGQIQQFVQEQQRQASEINVIKLMLNLVLPEFERWHLNGLAKPKKTFPESAIFSRRRVSAI